MEADIPLLGGRTNSGVIRRGDRVHRQSHVNSEFVHALLRHFEEIGFTAVPCSFGPDDVGRDVFEFIEGDVPAELTFHKDMVLKSAAKLIRSFHDASKGLISPQAQTVGLEVVCHNDLSPCNFVFRQRTPVAIIDFDTACLGRKVHDVGYAAWLWLQIGDDEISASEQRRRLDLFARAYGEIEIAAIVDAMLLRQDLLMREGQRNGNVAMQDWAQKARNWTQKELQ